jgi:hypothetical protein
MANVKNYGLVGVGAALQFSKNGLNLSTAGTTFTFQNAAKSAGASLSAADFTASTGNITATLGNISASAGSVTANTSVTAQTGNLVATLGDLTLSSNSAVVSIGGDTTMSRQQAGIFQFNGTAAVLVPSGSTAQQPVSAVAGMFRYNSDLGLVEFFGGSTPAWYTLATNATENVYSNITDGTTTSYASGPSPITFTGSLGVTATVAAANTNAVTFATSINTGSALKNNVGTGAQLGIQGSTAGYALIAAGAGTEAAFGKLNIAANTNVSGVLSTVNGGTGLASFTANAVFYASNTSTMAQSSGLTFNGTDTLTVGSAGSGTIASGAGESLTIVSTAGALTLNVASGSVVTIGNSTAAQYYAALANDSDVPNLLYVNTVVNNAVGTSYTAGPGLSLSAGRVFSANTDATTTYIDSSNNIAVKSSSTAGQVLVSAGSGSATWSTVNLASTSAVSGVLAPANGGTGVNNTNTITLSGDVSTGGALTTGSTLTTVGAFSTNGAFSTDSTFATNGAFSTTGAFTTAGAFTTTGANPLSIATTGTTSVTMPTSGTLLSTDTIANSAVTSISFGTTGLTPATANTGVVTVAGTLVLANGGTGSSLTASAGSIVYGDASSMKFSTVGTTGQVLTSAGGAAPTWTNVTNLNTGNTIVYRDATGSFLAGTATFAGDATHSGVTLNGTVTQATDATTKSYVDNLVAGLSWKQAVVVYGNIDVNVASAPASIDGVTLGAGDRILLAGNQTSAATQGIWEFVATGQPLTRTSDASTLAELQGASVFVEEGTQANTGWVQSTDPLPSFADQNWVKFSGGAVYTAGAGIAINGSSIATSINAGSALTNTANTNQLGIQGTSGYALIGAGAGLEAAFGQLNIASGTNVSGVLAAANGGTGVNNSNTITLGGDISTAGAFTLSGANSLSIATTGTTSVTMPTSGTLLSTDTIAANAVTSISFGSTGLTPATSANGAVTVAGTLATTNGGTGLTAFAANQVFYAGSTSTMDQSANFAFDGTSTLTVGGAKPVTIDGANAAVTATGTNSNLTLTSNGTGSVVVTDGKISSGANTAMTLTSTAGNLTVTLDTASIVDVAGPTAAEYALSLTDTGLTNKKYVDDAVANASSATSLGAVYAYSADITSATGTTNVGIAMPAGSTVMSVKLVVSSAASAGSLVVGKSGSTSAYMADAENDVTATGMYMAEDYVTEAAAEQIIVTTAGATGIVAKVIVTFQLKQVL